MSNIDMTTEAQVVSNYSVEKEAYKPEFNVVEAHEWQVRSKPDQWNKKGYVYASFETQEEAEKYAYNQKLIAQLQEEIRKLSGYNNNAGNAVPYYGEDSHDH